jgi:hypothetical protein
MTGDGLLEVEVVPTDTWFVSGEGQPEIGQADLVLSNRSGEPGAVRVDRVTVIGEDRSEHRDQFSLYDLTNELSIEGARVAVPAGQSVRVAVGFPAVTWWPRHGETIAIELEISIESRHTVRCPVSITEEFP